MIGDDSIPQAGPRHRVRLSEFWIDRAVVSMAHFELFIASGGYFENRWWSDSPRTGATFLEQGSVDKRCRTIANLSIEIAKGRIPRHASSHELPAVGLTWVEAAAVCRFFGARLPFEAEWEVAMQGSGQPRQASTDETASQTSQWGCEVYLGALEEWTAGAFSSRHWRDADLAEFATIDAPYGVCLKGSCRGGLFMDAAFRSSGDPLDAREFRGFRRVWCTAPGRDQLSANFEGRQL